jgi:hypothetical protein
MSHRRLDWRQDRPCAYYCLRSCLGNLWCCAAMFGAEPYLDDFFSVDQWLGNRSLGRCQSDLIWLAMNGFMLTDVIWCRTLLCRSGQRRRLNTLPEVREDQTLQWIIWSFSVVVSDGKHASLFVSEGGDMITHVVERSLEMLRTTSFHLSGCIDLRDIHDCDLATMQQWEDWMRGHPRFPRLCADLTSSACRTIHCDRVYTQHLWCGGKS